MILILKFRVAACEYRVDGYKLGKQGKASHQHYIKIDMNVTVKVKQQPSFERCLSFSEYTQKL